ncbi:MAG: hypothetical protein ABJL60_10960 [Ascidiaceihabitans sp.]
MIAGFEDVTEGGIFLFGDEIAKLAPNQCPVNTVFQNYALFPHMTILDNVGFGLEMKGASRSDARKRARVMLVLVQLTQFAHRKPANLQTRTTVGWPTTTRGPCPRLGPIPQSLAAG